MKRKLTYIFVTLLMLTGLIVTVLVYVSYKFENELEAADFKCFDTQVNEANVNILTRSITLSGVQLCDSMNLNRIEFYQLRVKEIRWMPLLLKNEIKIGKLIIDNASIGINTSIQDMIVELDPTDDSRFHFISLEDFFIQGSSFTFLDSSGKDTVFNTAFNFHLNGLNRDADKNMYAIYNYSFVDVSVAMDHGNFSYDSLYTITYDSLEFNTNSKALTVHNMSFQSEYGPFAMAPFTGNESDWYKLVNLNMIFKGLDVQRLLQDTWVVFNSGNLSSGTLEVIKDKRYPLKERPDKKFPPEILEMLPVKVHVDSLRIKDVDIMYQELIEGNDEPGVVSFTRLDAEFFNAGNIPSLIDGPTRIMAHARLMDEAVLYADIQLPNVAVAASYQCKGILSSMDMTALNAMLVPNAPLYLEKGYLDSLTFTFTYNHDESDGWLYFQYNSLDVKLKEDDFIKKIAASFNIVDVLLPDENQKEQSGFRKGEISAERNKKRSIFNFWALSVMSGIKNTFL